MAHPPIEVFPNSSKRSDMAAYAMRLALRSAIRKRGKASLVVTSGRSPAPVYNRLTKAELDWDKVSISLSDDSCVDPISLERHEELVRDQLLVGKARAAHFIPLTQLARDSEMLTHRSFSEENGLLPIDVLLLEMGDKGQIASLFPNHPVLDAALDLDSEQKVVSVTAMDPTPCRDRISLALPALRSAASTFILAKGEDTLAVLSGSRNKPVHALLNAASGAVRILWTA